MADRLSVIQSEESVKEIQKVIVEAKELVSVFKTLITTTTSLNKSFSTGKLKDYTNGIKDLKDVTQQLQGVNGQLLALMERQSRIDRNNAQAAAELARQRKESALAANAEARANKAQQKQTEANTSAYKRLSQEANKVKLMAKNLEAEILLLTRDFKTGVISQEKYNQELAKLQGQFSGASTRAKQLDAELKRIDANVGDRQRNVGNYREAAISSIKGLDGQIKSMVSMYLGFQAVITGGSKLIHNNYELSDSLADLQIRLNGNKEATDGLFESLKKIDTRTSLGELVNTASLVAKKGVAVDEIEGITKALDDYFIVAGKEAGNREEGTASIIKLISIFNEDKHITAERVTEISTALVKLQNSGVATGSKMIDVAERIGAVRGITGITLPQVLGFAAAIEQLGQKSEVAGTAGMQILTKILSDMPKYAKLAGISVEELRKTYNENPFEAVVKVSEGVLKTGDLEKISQDLEEVGVRGARVKGVLGDIAGNADFVRKRIKDASLAINEQGYLAETADKKQTNFAATLDKIGKEFELIGSNDGFTNFLKSTAKVVFGFIQILTAIPFGLVITGLTLFTAAWAYYKGMVIQATIAAQWNNSQSLLGTIRNKAARLGLLGEAEAWRANTIQAEANTVVRSLNVASLEAQIAAERVAIISLEGKTAANYAESIAIAEQIAAKEALIVALEAEVVATNQATAATTGLNAATKVSPLGIVLGVLAVVVPLMLIFADNTEKAAVKVRTLADNQKDLNSAMDKGVKNAAEEVAHLDELYKKYTNVNTPMKEKKEILKEWQDYYPSYFGTLKTEKDLNDKLASSYAELRDSIVSAARADAIRDKLKGRTSERLTRDEQLDRNIQKESELNKKLRAASKTNNVTRRREDGGDGKSFVVVEVQPSDLLHASDKRIAIFEQEKKNYKKLDNEEDRWHLEQLYKEEKRSTKLRGDRLSRLGKYAKNDEEKEKEKKYTGSKLDGAQKDRVMILEAGRDNELAINEKKFIDGTISEIQYLQKSLKINTAFFNNKIAFLNGSNAKEKSLVAKAELDKAKTLKEITGKIYDIQSKELEENNKKKINELERNSKALSESEYLTDFDRLQKQIEVDDQMIDQLSDYYTKQIALAENDSTKILELERKRDEEVGKIQDERIKKQNSLPGAIIKQIENQADSLATESEITYEQQKRIILSNKKLSNSEREHELDLLEKKEKININNREIDRLKALREQLILKQAINALNGLPPLLSEEDEKKFKELEAGIEKLTSENQVINIEIKDDIDEKTQKTRDTIAKGFGDLGFNGLADAYSETMKRLKNDTASWRDYAVLAAAAVLDAMTVMNTKQKERTIADLDEQLKHSQYASEQEIGFINGRLEQLNNLGELTEEQESDRRQLEDESRTYKEQQFQREKLIAIQKAKAEQKAAAQQALINGALAATTTLAQLGFIAGAIPAGLALAFGIAQSIAISSKNPVPQYWKGRLNGPAEFADTQERGREIITNNAGDIVNTGSDGGTKRTWLNEGDRVWTAQQSKNIIKNLGGIPKLGQNIFRKAAFKSLHAPSMNVVVNNTSPDYSQKIIDGLAQKIDSIMKRNSNPDIQYINGKIIQYQGSSIPVIKGEYDPKTGEEIWYK